ncbi:DUF397 domain-containing protein [Actinomadura graeca]|uniref:DUF397 domain-containing protein n=1 Tax=Actinomadura graeca TaxID=2750812 RepID=A0ABX8QXP8_9ACTN|nr:DUF397 domain-containing protein [Actinomadura graeca]QXJ22227.1 DUF397 domain-containing protein [Actinomadura graeca]
MRASQNSPKEAGWSKSSLSEGAGDCVEVTLVPGVALRDSKRPERPPLEFTASEWNAFLDGVKLGEFEISRLGGHPAG